ncbi:hypothetical protein Phi4:1_gp179 [Cellulophaga phage phi4:1]|uniref:Uncharacterized protein n=5 Tax=Lightbulbvirus TaxID=1918522 RepID=A0A0S2MWS8_9CAUD|nr:hypothetical protein Phi4:1_gp179 [Cellulophaga phage phi4:1]YP_008241678.1 hypothetical protein Phi17:2_gp183 [Cellulophaga phage phi17:2]ALO80188.1 hypothetical protein Phi4113_179 [Cellulophaga phage phi4:1_13]ALO80385.1 hypothetical protein Phi4118_179 [Cellulophaga phage phi4:1_18]ALO80586.1 hypothetical protein Phi17218_183 [Cellulophaga phage phi17:2_18]AGO47716.1 hypothetical protein Phi17:2_gp183 [Cellulophaga phage phi17:2]AGO49592.1 hypothetical protein Phi4:1_gp179 [Cellulophag
METTIMKAYVRKVMAKLTGDKNKELAERNFIKATLGADQQISSLKYKLAEAKISLEDKKKEVDNAKYPETLIGDVKVYFSAIKSAEESVEVEEEKILDLENSIEFFEALKVEFNQD